MIDFYRQGGFKHRGFISHVLKNILQYQLTFVSAYG